MTFTGAVSSCLRQYVTFSGRATRRELGYWVGFWLLGAVTAAIIGDLVNTDVLVSVWYVLTALPGLAVTARRLHDGGHTARWLLLAWIPLMAVVVLILCLRRSETGLANEYGVNPGTKASQPPITAA